MQTRVILVEVISPKTSKLEALKSMEELESLVKTYGGMVVIKRVQKRQIPDYKTYIGKGKLEEIEKEAEFNDINLIIINNLLKPQQLYNIEKKFEKKEVKIWDRVGLILKIFEKHAETSEARLQIELAAISHIGPRIFGMGLELSRQEGRVGTRGIGETNIEIMKRHLAQKEQKIREKLDVIRKRQDNQRKAREKKNFKTVAIVGYTNAGKSELLMSLTKKKVIVKDELFATLDTRIGSLFLPNKLTTCLLSDTIGFIQNLPPSLIDAFISTLDEALYANLLLHVIDYSDPMKEMKIKVVHQILKDLGANEIPMIYVCNKIDLIKNLRTKSFEKKYKKYQPVFVSALKKEKLKDLVEKIEINI